VESSSLREPIFVWRENHHPYYEGGNTCIYCMLELKTETTLGYSEDHISASCPFCGWGYDLHWFVDDGETYKGTDTCRVLRAFALNSAQLSFRELGQYIAKNYVAVGDLHPRRFEQLIGDVFRNHGFGVTLTQQSHDGGYDLIVLDSSGGLALVEIKSYRGKVGVELVRQLRGVQLRENIKKAVLVTSGQFTADAKKEARQSNIYQFEVDLVDAERLLRMLEVYKDGPPLLMLIESGRHGGAIPRPLGKGRAHASTEAAGFAIRPAKR
jgi:hypothetical protein